MQLNRGLLALLVICVAVLHAESSLMLSSRLRSLHNQDPPVNQEVVKKTESPVTEEEVVEPVVEGSEEEVVVEGGAAPLAVEETATEVVSTTEEEEEGGEELTTTEETDPVFNMIKLTQDALKEAHEQRAGAVETASTQLNSALAEPGKEGAKVDTSAEAPVDQEVSAETATTGDEVPESTEEPAAVVEEEEDEEAATASEVEEPAVVEEPTAATEGFTETGASISSIDDELYDEDDFVPEEDDFETEDDGVLDDGVAFKATSAVVEDPPAAEKETAVEGESKTEEKPAAKETTEGTEESATKEELATSDGASPPPAAAVPDVAPDTGGGGASSSEEPEMRDPGEFNAEVDNTKKFLEPHVLGENVNKLLSDNDDTEEEIKDLKVKIVEEENYIDGVIKKENLLQANLGADKAIVNDLESHMKAVGARVERIKKEKQLRLLEAQFHEYAAASSKLKGQTDDITTVKDALYSKMKYLTDMIKPLHEKEKSNMRDAVNADGNVKAPDTLDGAAAVTEETPEVTEA